MRNISILTLLLVTASVAHVGQGHETPLPPAVLGQTNYEELADFGARVRHIDDYRDNQYIFEARASELLLRSCAFENASLQLTVSVERVRKAEVFVKVEDAGETRILLQHADPPFYGNLQSISYPGSSSTLHYNQFAKPFALRIGCEIPLSLAVQLRKRDRLLIQGQIGSMCASIGPTFTPRTVATVVNWQVIERLDPEWPRPGRER